jgi:uncharacterized membrane protein YfcA
MESSVLSAITFAAAAVNGALGYGFSSLTVPVALLFMTSVVLNPALVLLQVGVNANVVLTNRAGLNGAWSHSLPILAGLGPGVLAGTAILASVNPHWMKLATYCILLPLVVLQAAGYRRVFQSQRIVGVLAGACLGLLYALTTISGPPLALLLANQGLAQREFRAAMGVVRLVQSSVTAVAYFYAGMITMTSVRLVLTILPGVIIAVPLGAFLARRLDAGVFKRLCASLNIWVIGLGLSTVLETLRLVDAPASYLVLAVMIAADAHLLRRFFTDLQRARAVAADAV